VKPCKRPHCVFPFRTPKGSHGRIAFISAEGKKTCIDERIMRIAYKELKQQKSSNRVSGELSVTITCLMNVCVFFRDIGTV